MYGMGDVLDDERNQKEIAIKMAAVFLTLYVGATDGDFEEVISHLPDLMPANEGTLSIEQVRKAVNDIAAE